MLRLLFFVFFDASAGFVTLTFTKHAKASNIQKHQFHMHKSIIDIWTYEYNLLHTRINSTIVQ